MKNIFLCKGICSFCCGWLNISVTMILSRDDDPINSFGFTDIADYLDVPGPFDEVLALAADPQYGISDLGNYSHVSGLEGYHNNGEPESPLDAMDNDILLSDEGNFFESMLPTNNTSDECFLYPDCKDLVLTAYSTPPIGSPDHELKDQVFRLSEVEVPESSAISISTKINKPAPTYTPDSDHCYSQTRSSTPSETSDSETSVTDAYSIQGTYELELDRRNILRNFTFPDIITRVGEVDIETIPEEDMHIPLFAVEVQRPGTQLSGSVPHVKRKRGAVTQRHRASYRVNNVQIRQQKGVARTKRGRRPALSAESSPCSSRTSSDTEEPEKRKMHNSMERLRRDHLREALHTLRVHVPALEHDEKAAKVKILDLSTKYIHEITEESEQYEKRKKILLKENKRLHKEYRALLRKYHTQYL